MSTNTLLLAAYLALAATAFVHIWADRESRKGKK